MNLSVVNVSSEASLEETSRRPGWTDSEGSGEHFSSNVLQQTDFFYERPSMCLHLQVSHATDIAVPHLFWLAELIMQHDTH